MPAGARASARVSCSAARLHKWGALRYDTAPVAGQDQAKTVVSSGRRSARDGVRVPGAKGSVTRVRMDEALMKI